MHSINHIFFVISFLSFSLYHQPNALYFLNNRLLFSLLLFIRIEIDFSFWLRDAFTYFSLHLFFFTDFFHKILMDELKNVRANSSSRP